MISSKITACVLSVAYRRLFSFAVNDGHGILKNDCTAILAAFEWMYRKQLGRRNLTGEQKAYMIGKMYEARKNTVEAPIGNANAENKLRKMRTLFKPPTKSNKAQPVR